MKIVTFLLGVVFLFLVLMPVEQANAAGINYYVSPLGSDSQAGTSPSAPWQTIAKVNLMNFQAGDKVFFQGGQTFSGMIYLDFLDVGTAADPVVIGSYGTGRATINGGNGGGFYAYNTAGIKIDTINFIGDGAATNTNDGVNFYLDLPGNVKLDTIIINNSDVGGFGKQGITIGSWNGKSGYKNIRVTNVASHDNGLNGLTTFGYFSITATSYSHQDVYVGYSKFYNNLGKSGLTYHSGSGVILSDIDGGTIEYSGAYNNGINNTNSAGPVGIWAWDSNDITIQYNESYDNRTSGGDGGGFDFDGGVTNSVLQYNYSHDNDGAGYLLAQFLDARIYSNNVVRYNISENDARGKGDIGAIRFWNGGSGIMNTFVYNNTVYVSPSSAGSPSAVSFISPTTGTKFYNNIFSTTGGVRLLDIVSGQSGLVFQNNSYWSGGSDFSITYQGANYSSLVSFRAGTNQERLNNSDVGFNLDPRLAAPGFGGIIGDSTRLAGLSAYKLSDISPLINQGLNLPFAPGLKVGARDFYGASLPQGSGYDLGAHEFIGSSAVSASDAAGNVSRQSLLTSSTTPAMKPPILKNSVRVITTTAINVRNKPSANSRDKIVGKQLRGSQGTITKDSQTGSGYTWWFVDFDTGKDGWVIDNSLQVRSLSAGSLTGRDIIASSPVRVRGFPSLSGTIIGIAFPKSVGMVLDGPVTGANHAWLKVKYLNGMTGWSASAYLSAFKNK